MPVERRCGAALLKFCSYYGAHQPTTLSVVLDLLSRVTVDPREERRGRRPLSLSVVRQTWHVVGELEHVTAGKTGRDCAGAARLGPQGNNERTKIVLRPAGLRRRC